MKNCNVVLIIKRRRTSFDRYSRTTMNFLPAILRPFIMCFFALLCGSVTGLRLRIGL